MAATLNDIQRKYGESVYPLYKDTMHEPYMENVTGNGYSGVVLYDELEDKIQCAECGKWFEKLSTSHLKSHEIKNVEEYKVKYGLFKKIALQSKRLSQLQSKSAKNNKHFLQSQGKLKNTVEYQLKANGVSNRSRISIAFKNKFGYCDAQIVSRLQIVQEIVKHPLRDIDLRKFDNPLRHHLENRFGTTNKGLEYYKYGSNFSKKKYIDAEMIGVLRNFVIIENKIPQAKDLKRYDMPSLESYRRYFGSWRRAKMMAGLDQLLEK